MKKILLSALVCSAVFASNSHAQLADESVAPDFTVARHQWNSAQFMLIPRPRFFRCNGCECDLSVGRVGLTQSGALEDLYVNRGWIPWGFCKHY